LSRFPWPIIFKPEIIKTAYEYENVTQKVLLFIESILQDAKKLQHARLYFVVSVLKIIGHGNPDNNIESHCISTVPSIETG
jgi:hypothetical protein